MSEETDPVLKRIRAARFEMGEEMHSTAVRMVGEWEDSTETASEFVYRLWRLFHGLPVPEALPPPEPPATVQKTPWHYVGYGFSDPKARP